MKPRQFVILGIPVDNLDTNETVENILALIKQYRKKHPANIAASNGSSTALVCTLNSDYLANVQGLSTRTVKHPELIQILRSSHIITADGTPIVWLSRLLGNPLKERMTGSDLIPRLAEALGENENSIYLLGGEKEQALNAAKHLQSTCSGLKIAGLSCPEITISGIDLVEAQQRDALIVEEINKASPDVLLISLEHPKQEIWFERVRKQLRVPVVIGIGGTINFLSGKIKRAPLGLRRLYRLAPRLKSFFRSVYNFIYFLYLSIPLILIHRINRFIYSLKKQPAEFIDPLLFLSEEQSLAVIKVPRILDANVLEELEESIEEAFAHDAVLLDFYQTRHIDLDGLGLLVRVWKRLRRERKSLLAFGVHKDLALLLRMHRVWDFLSNEICLSPEAILNRLREKGMTSALFEAVSQIEGKVTFSFFGRLDNTQDVEQYFQKLIAMVYKKDCILDFQYCTGIDNAGFCFLFRLKQFVEANNKSMIIRGLSKNLQRQFKIAKADGLFFTDFLSKKRKLR